MPSNITSTSTLTEIPRSAPPSVPYDPYGESTDGMVGGSEEEVAEASFNRTLRNLTQQREHYVAMLAKLDRAIALVNQDKKVLKHLQLLREFV